ncbi:hypothetical protein [Mycolicibacterium sp.]|uniref:hypothetical protein n=1 Tax=Mycolicibacterium sp. TaxID=2320850 RepID=UPI0025F0990C|nr:hypothetical protein [Mycolicibacterium sp.]
MVIAALPPTAPSPGWEVHAVNLAGARADGLLNRVRAEMPAAVGAVDRFWGTDWTREIVVVATGAPAQFVAEAGLDPSGEWADIAAVSVADEVDPVRRRVSGQRIVLAPGAAAMSDSALRIVLAHELFHLAARADTAADAPRWLTEGVADFVARSPSALPPDAGSSTALPSDADLDTPGPDRAAGYDRAWWFARFVADTYGAEGLRRLYGRACGPGHADLRESVHDALGEDLVEVSGRWAAWLGGKPSAPTGTLRGR